MRYYKLLLGAAVLAVSTNAQATPVFAVDEVNNLIAFNSANPSVTVSSVAITGLTDSIQALDFRPLNGILYGVSSAGAVYTINTSTGVATSVGGPFTLTGSEFGFDFNPSIDRLRIVSNTNQNYVFNPNTGTIGQFTNVFYAAGDPNAGRNPDVTALAYTSAAFGGTTQLFAIDTALDVLDRQANSAGTLNTVGALGLNAGSRTSFDISGSNAFALNGRSLYSVNLGTGSLSFLGTTDRNLFGIAISTAVPEPSSWAMMIGGFGAVGGAMRYRRRKTTTAFA